MIGTTGKTFYLLLKITIPKTLGVNAGVSPN
jgi:hypothetical protein